ncbi:MAG: hypothetical protein UY52_C0001G0081 [Parcubacteria group bacterium GW2011_GWC2_49_9]|nr:MAG: hypothetical protein UY34_C0009G0004 [Parcubacteria group bacterium GW2011_GWA2_48_9]KKW16761.1 MAG: hypothetical protein UY52_C0001G0081 [Parcubacteria group bacterium GW2011_GWC2_49_9]
MEHILVYDTLNAAVEADISPGGYFFRIGHEVELQELLGFIIRRLDVSVPIHLEAQAAVKLDSSLVV